MTSLQDRRVLLVGGAGFIGHNLAIRLKQLGADVAIVDGLQVNNLSSFLSTTEPDVNRALYVAFIHERLRLLEESGIMVQVQDARDYHALSRTMTKLQPDTVVHLAAAAHANRANKDPYSTFDHSTRTLENALDASRSLKPHFIYFSSSMVYGNFQEDAVSEDTDCNPIGIYGALKFGGEKLVIAYNQVFDLPFTIVRPSALYGERCVSRRVIQVFIEKALRGQPLTVYGNGEDRLDFTYITDLVQGVVRVISDERASGEIFNLTFGNARSLMDVVGILSDIFPNLPVDSEERDHLMPERGTLSIGKARQVIGYQPEYPLERAVPQYVEWYQRLVANRPELLAS